MFFAFFSIVFFSSGEDRGGEREGGGGGRWTLDAGHCSVETGGESRVYVGPAGALCLVKVEGEMLEIPERSEGFGVKHACDFFGGLFCFGIFL